MVENTDCESRRKFITEKFDVSHSIQCIGLDQSEIVIEENMAKLSKLGLDATIYVDDIGNCNYDSICDDPYSIYSRFTLHAINIKRNCLNIHLAA